MNVKSMKKGFTLTELIIVIVIIGILAGVLIPTFINVVNKANKAADLSLIRNLNEALTLDRYDNGEHKNMTQALKAADDYGFAVDKIDAKVSKNKILWDSKNDVFCYLVGTTLEYYPKSASEEINLATESHKLWVITDKDPSTSVYSVYYTGEALSVIVNNVGFDVGKSNVTEVKYNGDVGNDVVIRTNGGTLNVGSEGNVAKGQIYHYGALKDATIFTEHECFHTYGAIGNMNLKAGKAIAEKDSLVYLVTATTSVEIEEKDNGKFFIPSGTTQAEDGTGVPATVAAQVNITPKTGNTSNYAEAQKTGGNVYEIGNLAALEQYRDLVNTGFNFTGITVKLVADIRLNDGWIPIGEGARKSGIANDGNTWVHAGTSFEGIFDGNGHTIYNLNNKGFVPTLNRLGTDGNDYIYSYGFIGQSTTGAKVMNLTFKDVDIDTERYEGALGDSVGSVIGFCAGGCELSKVSVYGSVRGYEAVGGLIGRAYNQDAKAKYQDLKILDCNNYANVECFGTYHAAGLIGYISYQNANINNTATRCEFDVTITGCYVEGEIKTKSNDLSGLFNSWYNNKTHTVKNNNVNCQLVCIANDASKVKWAAYIVYSAQSDSVSSTFGTGEEANAKGDEFSAMVNNVDLTSSILEH